MTKLPELVGAVIDDTVGLAIPGGAVAGALVSGFLRRRYEQARDIVLEELRAGRLDAFEAASQDDAIAITLRIMRAAREGTARLNLRLLAKVIAGQAQRGAFVADEFRLYADMLESLSRDEIIVIATLHKYAVLWEMEYQCARKQWLERLDPSDRKRAELGELPMRPEEDGGLVRPWKRTVQDLVPEVFQSEERLAAIASRAQRSGLIVTSDVMARQYQSSPIMTELAQLADFQDALRREGIQV